MLHLLCNDDVSAKLTRAGLDIRPHFEARRSHPVTWRIVHGAFAAPMYRPTRRERLAGWWYAHRWPLLRGAILTLSCLAMWVALNLLLDAGNALADWISGVWR